jgi:hypothetical protein
MNYIMLDQLCVFAESSRPDLEQDLIKQGVVDLSGEVQVNMVNILSGIGCFF